jgi:acyl-CoA reductase-like NAD-dependent aldehyde dehydrogenase
LPVDTARRQVEGAAAWFDHFGDQLGVEGGTSHRQLGDATTWVVREPIGVCALFSPWNVPIGLSAIKLAPCLAAGNSAVLKPSELTAMAPRRLVEILHACGLPEGVLGCVNGPGHQAGAALAAAGRVDMISFTGGALGGVAVAEQAARRHVPCVLELGGKSATVVFDDADFEAAIDGALQSMFANNGEACLAGSRILVQAGIAERFMATFAQRAQRIRLGDPLEQGTEMGPMVSAAHRDKVRGFFDSCARQGDHLLCGGPGAPVPDVGAYVAPSAYRVASFDSRLWQEEVFGPVAAFHVFQDEAEAVAQANNSRFGLVAYVWTRDVGRAMRTALAIRAGTLLVNTPMRRELNAPFGGYKASGVGREGGQYSWNNFTQAKAIVMQHGR